MDDFLRWVFPILAILTALGNAIAYIYARIELQRQRKETRELVRLTSDLDNRVHVLSTHLDQKIYQLNRIRDLTTGLMHVSIALRQVSRAHNDKLDISIKRGMTQPELDALIRTVNDPQLNDIANRLVDILNNEIWAKMWNEKPYDMGEADELIVNQTSCIRDMHLRILELLEATTQIE